MDRQEIEDLIARVALQDRAAFEQLYDRVSAKLFGVCNARHIRQNLE